MSTEDTERAFLKESSTLFDVVASQAEVKSSRRSKMLPLAKTKGSSGPTRVDRRQGLIMRVHRKPDVGALALEQSISTSNKSLTQTLEGGSVKCRYRVRRKREIKTEKT